MAGNLRITQTHASILADTDPAVFDGTGKLRITQTHAAVLADTPAGFDGVGEFRATQIHTVIAAATEAGFDGSGEFRTTQVHVIAVGAEEAGFDGAGTLRVTQVHLSVLAGLPAEAAGDEIALTEEVEAAMGFNREVSDTIALTENAASVTAEDDDIALDEEIVLHHGRTVTDGMALAEDIDLSFGRTVEDAITLTDEAMRVVTVEEETIVMADSAVKIYTPFDTIALTETTFNSDHVYVTDTISMADEAEQEPTPSDEIELSETLATFMSRERDGEDEIELFETISYVVNADCPECCDNDEDYHPFIGVTSNPNLPEPPAQEAPTLTPSHSVVLSYPFMSPTATVTLRAPQFGNRESVSNNRIHRESRGGTLIIYSDTQWPKIKRLRMEFTVLTEAQAQDYLSFRATSLGQIIRLVDHESRTWQGVLIETDTPIVRNLRACGVSASLTFEGELV